jgi:hypothetical protein
MRLRLFAVATLVLFSTMVCGQQVVRNIKKETGDLRQPCRQGSGSLASRVFVRLQPVRPRGGGLPSETISNSNGCIMPLIFRVERQFSSVLLRVI